MIIAKQSAQSQLCNKNKMKTSAFVILATFAVLISSNSRLIAQDDRNQAVNVCALAIPLMHMYVVNYEYLYQNHHGLAARIEYVPNMKGADTKGNAWAGVINYRWHFSPKLENFFAGPYARYRYVYGSGNVEGIKYEYDVPELNFGLNGGYRWVSKIGFNVVLSAGYGYSFVKDNLTPSNKEVIEKFDAFKKANDTNSAIFDAPYYAEFSIGYVF